MGMKSLDFILINADVLTLYEQMFYNKVVSDYDLYILHTIFSKEL